MANLKLIQWNLNGMSSRYCFLQKLIHDYEPELLCIQETNFKGSSCIQLKNYNIFYKNRVICERASGGVAIYVHNRYTASIINLNTNLEATAVQVLINDKKIHNCKSYLIINMLSMCTKNTIPNPTSSISNIYEV